MNGLPYSEVTIESVLKSMGADLLFIEVGVLRATTLAYIADNCLNVSAAVGIDSYKPYVDSLEPSAQYSVNESLALMNLCISKEKIRNAKRAEIIKLVLMDCVEAADLYEDGIVDCVFLDAYMNEQDVCDHVKAWLPKIRRGGVLLGHDIHTRAVKDSLHRIGIEFSELSNNIWMHKV